MYECISAIRFLRPRCLTRVCYSFHFARLRCRCLRGSITICYKLLRGRIPRTQTFWRLRRRWFCSTIFWGCVYDLIRVVVVLYCVDKRLWNNLVLWDSLFISGTLVVSQACPLIFAVTTPVVWLGSYTLWDWIRDSLNVVIKYERGCAATKLLGIDMDYVVVLRIYQLTRNWTGLIGIVIVRLRLSFH